MSETREPYRVSGTEPGQQDFTRLSSEVIAFEMLKAMDNQALIEVYRLLVKLKQQDAAAFLAEYARRIAKIDVKAQSKL